MNQIIRLAIPVALLTGVCLEPGLRAQNPPPDKPAPKKPIPEREGAQPYLVGSILADGTVPIDLAGALRLAGVQNPEILLARERVTEAVALRQLAAAQILPNINAGTNIDLHHGPLQQSNGNILEVHRGSLYLGLGASAVAAGTVGIPGISWNLNVSDAIFAGLVARQVVRQRQWESVAVRNDMLLRVAAAYLELLRAEERRVIALQNRDEVREVARVTANFAKAGQGRPADADRAATELEQRNAEFVNAENDILVASARLCQLLGLDPSTRLRPVDGAVVPAPIVPDPIPVAELIAIALVQRPELRERQEAIRAALLELHAAKALPFSPNVIVGYSAGTFGGGSNLAAEGVFQPNGTFLQRARFGSFDGRQDFDAIVYWQLRNLGIGNLAIIRQAQSHLRSTALRETEVLDRVRAEVAKAYARTHARYAQIETNERAVATSQRAFQGDFIRTRNNEGLPIEVLDSLRLLGRARNQYLDAIIDYNLAQFELYVALGQPPAEFLARPVPADIAAPIDIPAKPAAPQ